MDVRARLLVSLDIVASLIFGKVGSLGLVGVGIIESKSTYSHIFYFWLQYGVLVHIYGTILSISPGLVGWIHQRVFATEAYIHVSGLVD